MTRLTKALERSDKYIEELEGELKSYREGKGGTVSDRGGKSIGSRGDKNLPNGELVLKRPMSDSKVLPSVEHRERNEHSRRQLFSEDKGASKTTTGEGSKHYYLTNGHAKGVEHEDDYMDYETDKNYGRTESSRSGVNKGQKRVTFDLRNDTNATTSFDLELPSPVKTAGNRSSASNRPASLVKGVLKNGQKKSGASDKSDDRLSTDHSRIMDDSLSSSYNEKPSRRSDLYSKDDDLVYMQARAKSREASKNSYQKSNRKYSADDSVLSEPNDAHANSDDLLKRSSDLVKRASDLERYSSGTRKNTNDYDRKLNLDSDDSDKVDLDDTIHIESELGDLDISLTPELSDCMKLLNRAEKNVHHRESDDDLMVHKPRKLPEVNVGYRSTSSRETDLDLPYRTSSSRSSDIGSDHGHSSVRSNDMDTAFRASTGSYSSRLRPDDLSSDYKPGIESKFSASVDSYSSGRHRRSGSLDNLLVDVHKDPFERPSSALPTTSNMYSAGLPSSKYTAGLTTGRTKLTRTPSLDNLLPSRQSDGYSTKFDTDFSGARSRLSMPGYLGQRPYRGENAENLDVKALPGQGSTNLADLEHAGRKEIENIKGGGSRHEYEAILEARAKSLADVGAVSMHDRHALEPGNDIAGKSYTTGRHDINMDMADRKYTPAHAAPSLTSQSDFTSLPRSSTDKLTLTGPGAPSGRLTPTLPSSSNPPAYSRTNPTNYDHIGSGPSSLPADISHKPPIAGRPYDSSKHGIGSASSRSSALSGEGYSSMPTHSSGTGSSGYTNSMGHLPSRSIALSDLGQSSKVNNYDAYQPDLNGYHSSKQKANYDGRFIDDKYSSSSSNANDLPLYNANRLDVDTYNPRHSHDYSSKVSHLDQNAPKPVLPASDNYSSAVPSFTGPSSMATYSATSFLPTTFTSISSGSSYSTAISVPLTLTTSSYSSSRPSTSYAAKPMEPLSEHYSYVSNVSGGDLSKSDTFALPEPKKRLFDSTDDLDMSMSPIKSNKRY